MSLETKTKEEIISKFAQSKGDTGSPEVQIALLTSRISRMTEHMRECPKDYASRRGLLRMVSRRRRLLDYVKRINPTLYLDLLKRLEIRK